MESMQPHHFIAHALLHLLHPKNEEPIYLLGQKNTNTDAQGE
jgi:hypothetical protein